MARHYTHKEPCPFDPKRVIIYKMSDSPKQSWYVRIKRAGKNKGYYAKTLDCVDKRTALKRAKQKWIDVLTAEERGVDYGSRNFSIIFQRWLDKDYLSTHRRERIVPVYRRYFSEFFGSKNIDSITTDMFTKYIRWRWDYWTEWDKSGADRPDHTATFPSANTLRSERQILTQFLNWCKVNHLIEAVPYMPYQFKEKLRIPVENTKSRGKSLTDAHHAAIVRRLYEHAKVKEWEAGMSGKVLDADGNIVDNFKPDPMRYMPFVEERTWARLRMYYFVVITGNLLLRQGTEASKLVWEDVEHRRDPNDERKKYAIIRVRHGKKGARDPIFTPYGRAYSQVVRWHRIAKSFGCGGPTDHIFGALDGSHVPVHYIGRVHGRCLKKWRLDRHTDGTRVTLYTYRHTAIRRRIVKSGWDIFRVAKAANTSALTISKSYAHDWMEAEKERYTNVFRNPSDLERVMDKQPELYNEIDAELEAIGVV